MIYKTVSHEISYFLAPGRPRRTGIPGSYPRGGTELRGPGESAPPASTSGSTSGGNVAVQHGLNSVWRR